MTLRTRVGLLITRRICVALLLLAGLTGTAQTARRPRYGGILRLQTEVSLLGLYPAQWRPSSAEGSIQEKIFPLVFEGLTRFDGRGRIAPCLATSWKRAADQNVWEFALRQDVRFHDGTRLTVGLAAAALGSVYRRGKVEAVGEKIVVRTLEGIATLPEELALPGYGITYRDPGGALLGTGPFQVNSWTPGRELQLGAFEEHWEGRPFLDGVQLLMGRSPREQRIDLELGKADVVEAKESTLHRESPRPWTLCSSASVELLALIFDRDAAGGRQRSLREALALSIGRTEIQRVLLRGEGQPAGSLLPEWLSGYAFLFNSDRDAARARQLVAGASQVSTLSLAYDSSDALARIVAERVAVDARQAGLLIRPVAPAPSGPTPEIRMVRLRISAPLPELAIARLAEVLDRPIQDSVDPERPESLYQAESALLEGYWVIPLIHLPEIHAVGNRVANWPGEGTVPLFGWKLATVWLTQPRPGPAQ
ncbi:MAG: ABC transporter substrate-binding protein [Acidobacteriota bacterium]